MNLYQYRLFDLAITNFGKVDVKFPKEQNVCSVQQVSRFITLIKNKRCSYTTGAKVNFF